MLLSLLVASVAGAAHADDAAIKSARQPGHSAGGRAAFAGQRPETVLTDSGVLYASEDGKHILQGPLFDVSGKEPVNVTNQLLSTKMDALKDQMIVYKRRKRNT